MRHAAVVLAVMIPLAACGGGGSGDGGGGRSGDVARSGEEGSDVATTPIVFETVAKGAHGAENPAAFAARSQDEFDARWADAGGQDAPSLTGVDFGSQIVLAVLQGQQPTAGYNIEITGVAADHTVTYVRSEPAEGCMTAQVLTAPFHVVAVPAFQGDVSFVAEEAINPC